MTETERKTDRRGRRALWLLLLLLAVLVALAVAFCVRLLLRSGAAEPEPAQVQEELPRELTDAEKLDHIRENAALYPEELLHMAETNEETIDFVYAYPEKKDQSYEIDLSAEAAEDAVPLLLQWDERWGYTSYGTGILGYNGCGPTSLSMVALYLTGDPVWTPPAVAALSQAQGYYLNGNGTTWGLMSEGCALLGLEAREVALDENAMASALETGPLILNLGPGDFTENGHYLVVTGHTAAGFTLNDPNSPARSARTWTFDELQNQIRNIWVYTPAEEEAEE